MASLFFSSVRPRSLAFHGFTVPNPKPKSKRRLDLGVFPFRPRPGGRISAARGEELGIVSISECADGSVVFRFGDASEIEEERVRVAAEALVSEDVKGCEEIGVFDDEIGSVTEGLVESSSLVMEMVDHVEENVSVGEAVEGESDDGLDLGEALLKGRVMEGETLGGFELSEAVLDTSLRLECFVDKDSDSGDGELKLSETSLGGNVGLEEGFVDKDSVNGGLELNEMLCLEKKIVDKDGVNSINEVEGETDHGMELSETLLEEIVRLEEGSVKMVDGESDRGLELSETLLEEIVPVEEGSVKMVDGESDRGLELCETLLKEVIRVEEGSVKMFDGESDRGLELSETLLEEIVRVEEGSVKMVDGESDRGLELSETLLEEIVRVEEGSVKTGDVVEGEIDRALDLNLSETLLGTNLDIDEVCVENSGTGSDMVEVESNHSLELSETLPEASVEEGYAVNFGSGSDCSLELSETLPEESVDIGDESYRPLELSETLPQASVNIAEVYVENTGSDLVEGGESDRSLELSETITEANVNIEEGGVENNGMTEAIVMEVTEKLENVQLAEVNVEDANEESIKLENGNCENNAELKGGEFVTQLASLEPNRVTDVHDSYESVGRSKENANIEAPQQSRVAVNTNAEREVNNVSGEHTDDTLEAKPILDEETSYETVAGLVETDQITSSEMLDVSNLVETITEDDAQSSNIADESIQDQLELQLTPILREEVSTTELFLSSGASIFPVASKALTGREDAYLVASRDWLGVADGVSEWSLEGINVGSYARELMENCDKIVSDNESVQITNPVEVLTRSVSDTESHGSSTALVAFFDGQVLRVANIGDSGFVVVRNDNVFKRSSPMVHGINFPVHIKKGDDPSELVEEYEIDLSEDDVIVIATDGLFDNLYEDEIASIASNSAQAGLEPQEIAELLAARALEVGSLGSSTSPFAEAVQAAGYAGYTGGKLDDVAVIVSLVQKKSKTQLKQV